MGGTTLTEHLLNTGRRPQTPKRARKSPLNWIEQKKKKKIKRERKESGWDPNKMNTKRPAPRHNKNGKS